MMKLSKNFGIRGLLLITVAINQVTKNEAAEAVSAIRGLVMSSFYIPGPIGPIIGGIGYLISETLIEKSSDDKKSEPINSEQFEEKMKKMTNHITEQSDRIIAKLEGAIFDNTIGEDLRKALARLDNQGKYYKCMIENSVTCEDEDRESSIRDLTNSESEYRTALSSFIPQFIKSKETAVDNVLGHKEHILRRMVTSLSKKVTSHQDCYDGNSNNESGQIKIYNTAIYILQILSKAYAIVLLAYVEKYQARIKSDVMTPQKVKTIMIAKNYFNDVSILLNETSACLNLVITRDIRPCDPTEYKRGANYERLTNFIQPTLIERSETVTIYSNILKNKQCNHDQTFNINQIMKDNPSYTSCTEGYNELDSLFYDPEDNERMYHRFIEHTWYGGVKYQYGRGGDEGKNLIEKKSLCKPLLCWVDNVNGTNTVRRFSLQLSHAREGYVVTGVRLVVKKKVIYIEIQEGLLVDNSYVDPKTVLWQEAIENYNLSKVLHINDRSLSFDDVILPPGSFVTGVEFGNANGKLELNVHGIIPENKTRTFASPLNTNARKEIVLDAPDLSELAPHDKQHVVTSKAGVDFLKFRPTDFQKDLEQITVPYLDIQEVVTNPPSPVGGIGTYYKSMYGYGGFVGLKLLSVDVVNNLHTDMIHAYSKKMEKLYEDAEKEHKKKKPSKNSDMNVIKILDNNNI